MPRIKICYVITRLIKGGAQKVCLDLIESLPKDQYEMYLVSGAEIGPEGSLWDRAKSIENLNIKVINSLVRNVSIINDQIAFIKLYFYFRKIKPDIVHCHTSKAGFIGCVAAKLAGVPVIIYSPHGHIFASHANIPGVSESALKRKVFYWLRRLASAFSTRIIALNQADKDEQVALKLAPEGKYEVIYNGIDLINMAPATGGRKFDKNYPVLAAVGRLSPEKGHIHLFQAIKILKNNYPSILLLLIGDGIMRNRLEQLAGHLDISANVRFIGLSDNPSDWVKDADIFVLPSLYEAFGIVLLEAMALRKPIIASNVNGVPEVVLDNKTGILVPPADSTALSEAIIKLTINKGIARLMGEEGRQRVKELFLKETMADKFDKLYKRLFF
jgi:glycosyltransferase involved in cell wall biosynthesis